MPLILLLLLAFATLGASALDDNGSDRCISLIIFDELKQKPRDDDLAACRRAFEAGHLGAPWVLAKFANNPDEKIELLREAVKRRSISAFVELTSITDNENKHETLSSILIQNFCIRSGLRFKFAQEIMQKNLALPLFPEQSSEILKGERGSAWRVSFGNTLAIAAMREIGGVCKVMTNDGKWDNFREALNAVAVVLSSDTKNGIKFLETQTGALGDRSIQEWRFSVADGKEKMAIFLDYSNDTLADTRAAITVALVEEFYGF